MGKCVYCLSIEVPFSTEHILPHGFGNFENLLTLPKSSKLMCKACNEELGRLVDIVLQRNTPEGHKRLDEQGRVESLRPEHFKNTEYYIVYGGDPVFIDPELFLKSSTTRALTQVILVTKDKKRESIVGLDAIRKIDAKKYRSDFMRIFAGPNKTGDGPDKQAAKEVIESLKAKGIGNVKLKEEAVPPSVPKLVSVYVKSTYEADSMRALSKIGFGLAAHEFDYKKTVRSVSTFLSNFSDIRNFIRYGEAPMPEVEFGKPMINGESERFKTKTGSTALMTLSVVEGVCKFGIRFYDNTTYHVTLATGLLDSVKHFVGYTYGSTAEPKKVKPLTVRKSNLSIFTYGVDAMGNIRPVIG